MPRVTLFSGGGGMGIGIIGKKHTIRQITGVLVAALLLITPASALNSLRVEKISSQLSRPTIECRIAYPHISGIVSEQNQQLLNVDFAEQAQIFRAKADYAAKSQTVKANMDYRVMRNQDGILSLVSRRTIASGSGEQQEFAGMTIDTVGGQRFFLSDLFIDHADYVATLSGQIQDRIKQSHMTSKQIKKFDQISENQAFYLTGDALVIFFSQGQYFTDECLVKEFTIPLKSLEGILKPQYCISQ
jgi:hypothetical protein